MIIQANADGSIKPTLPEDIKPVAFNVFPGTPDFVKVYPQSGINQKTGLEVKRYALCTFVPEVPDNKEHAQPILHTMYPDVAAMACVAINLLIQAQLLQKQETEAQELTNVIAPAFNPEK